MRRKLLIANAALVVLAGLGLWRLRVDSGRAGERYRILNPHRATGPAAAPEPAAPHPVQPAAFFDAAEKFLFSPDRNPTVVVDPPKVKDRPKLPQFFGVMNIGSGPIALLAPDSTTRHKPVRIGEKIGEFELVAVTSEQITLGWEGEKIQAPISDLLPKSRSESRAESTGAAVSSSSPAGSAGATVLNPTGSGRAGDIQIGPAVDTPSGKVYSSLPGDTAPAGAIHQGKRKVVRVTPFGQQAWWEDIKP